MNTTLLPPTSQHAAGVEPPQQEIASTSATTTHVVAEPVPAARIVCGTDFTPGAAAAANVAQILASRLDASLLLVHVVDQGWMDFLPEHVHVAANEGLERRMDEEEKRLAARGRSLTAEFRSGAAEEALVEMGEEAGTELLVLAAVGRRKCAQFSVGRVAERVAECGAVPTLIVHSALAFENWANGKQTLRVIVGVDFSAASEAALQWVGKLWRAGGCEVVAVHAAWPHEQRVRHGRGSPHGNDLRYLQRILEAELHASLGTPPSGETARARVQPEWDRVDNGLLRIAEEEHADLVVVGTNPRHGLSRLRHGSVSRGVLHRSFVNVCCVPPSAESSRRHAALPALKRVLVSTDFSEAGNLAIPYAFSLVQGGGAVCLVHVLPPSETGERHRVAEASEARHQELIHTAESAAAALRALVPAEAEDRGIFSEFKVIEDRDAARTICEAANHFGADLICMSRHGLTGLARARLGSVTQEVLSSTSRAMLIIRPPA